MGKQYNKTIKRRRREAYLKRKKEARPKVDASAKPAKPKKTAKSAKK